MSLVKHNNNSISDINSAGQLAQGKMTLISSQTASGSASIEFTSGIDSAYPIYKFEFINIHPSTDTAQFQFNMSTNAGSNYNVTKTTTHFRALHKENGIGGGVEYRTQEDLAQSTAFQPLTAGTGSGADESSSGSLILFNPSSTTYVKHFIANLSDYFYDDYMINYFIAGYGNTTSAVNAIKFQMSSGNIDSGTIKLYGIGD